MRSGVKLNIVEHKNCEVCVANDYGLWSAKEINPEWPKKVQKIFKKLQAGDGLIMEASK